MLKSIKLFAGVLLCVPLLFACGYRFSGGGDLPRGIRAVYVQMFDNRTAETGLENTITNDLIYELTRSGKVTVTDRERADAVLSGVIRALYIVTVARKSENAALERRVTVSVDLKLTDSDGKVVWSTKGFSANETYEVADAKLTTEKNKTDAIVALSKRLAERAFNRMTEDF